MHVLVIPTWYPNGDDKLIGIYHKEFCKELAKRKDIKVNMLYVYRQKLSDAFKYIFMKKFEIIDEENYKTYMIKNLDVRRISYSFQMKRYVKTLEKVFKRYIKENGMPDVIHAHVTIPAGYASCKLGEKYGIPVVVTEHATYFERFLKGNDKQYSDYVLTHSYYTTVSNYMKKRILEEYDNCDVLPNLVDVESFMLSREKINDLKLITVVGLRKIKRVDDIIRALKLIIEDRNIKNASLTVVGDGLDANYYKEITHELNMDKYVTFTGKKTKEEIAKILNKSNIYVMSSELETFGIPGVEALASGIPVVATKCLGPEEYIDSKNGKLISIANINEMADAILDIYKNIDKYDVKYLRKTANKYSSKTVIDKAISIYNKIINAKE